MKKLTCVLVLWSAILVAPMLVSANDLSGKLNGSWTYHCKEAPYPYQTGTLKVGSKDKKATVDVILKDGQLLVGKNVADKDGKLSFEIWVEDSLVKVVIEKKGEKVIGSASSSEGTMALVAEKSKGQANK